MQTLLATVFAALAITAPAQASDEPVAHFVGNRTATLCMVQLGLATIEQATEWEWHSSIRDGLTPHQIFNFNAASDEGWVKDAIAANIKRLGGCKKLYTDAMRNQRNHSKPMHVTRPAYLY